MTTPKAEEAAKGQGHSHTAGGTVKCYSQSGIRLGRFFKKLSMQLPYDPVIAPFSIYSREIKIFIHKTYAYMFIAALFIKPNAMDNPDVHLQVNG